MSEATRRPRRGFRMPKTQLPPHIFSGPYSTPAGQGGRRHYHVRGPPELHGLPGCPRKGRPSKRLEVPMPRNQGGNPRKKTGATQATQSTQATQATRATQATQAIQSTQATQAIQAHPSVIWTHFLLRELPSNWGRAGKKLPAVRPNMFASGLDIASCSAERQSLMVAGAVRMAPPMMEQARLRS